MRGEHLADGIPIFARNDFNTFVDDYGSDMDVTATFIALCDVHTSCTPTGKFSQAHTTIDPSIRLHYARAYKFTHAIDESLEHFVAHEPSPFYFPSV